MSVNEILPEDIKAHFDVLAKIGNLGAELEDGFLRASWSDEETDAMEYIRKQAEAAGMTSRYDALGNLFLRAKGVSDEVFQIGSHLDTVPRGGLFDGGAGIVCGLEAMLAVLKSGAELKKGMELVIWRGEESGTYDLVYKGSKAAFGQLAASALETVFDGGTLEAAISGQGYDPELIRSGTASISQEEIDAVVGHVELHIEQATKLERDECDIAVVNSIRAARRYRVILRGEAAHSGGTPMGAQYRRDANLAMSYMQVRLDEMCQQELAAGNDLVQTIGVINSDKVFNERYPEVFSNGLTKVSPFAYFFLDIRSNVGAFLESYSEKVLARLRSVAEEFGVELELETISTAVPVEALDGKLQDVMQNVSNDLGYKTICMPSGAGHDAAVVAQQKRSDGAGVPTGMVFIPCRDGVSHNPLEFTTNEAMAKGANVLARTLLAYCV